MLRIFVAALGVAALTASAVAQNAAAPYVGQVKATEVYVRSGNSLNYYPMLKISRPAKVTVVDKVDGWLKILPPDGAFSLISKRFVDVSGDVGTVNGDAVRVRAGSDIQPTSVTTEQTRLNRGDKVKILGATEEYYKIAPPKGAYAWISVDFVERVDGEVPAAATQMADEATSQPTSAPAVAAATPAKEKADEVAIPADIAAEPVAKAGPSPYKAFQEAENALKAEYAKSADQRDLPKVLAMYQAIAADNSLKPSVDSRIRFLQAAIARNQAIAEAADTIRKAKEAVQKGDDDISKIPVAPPASDKPLAYAAQGRLMSSELFDGSGITPKRWAVRDGETGRIVAYAQCTTGAVNLQKLEGWNVGLFGARKYEPRLLLYVIEVEKVVTLGEPRSTRAAVPGVPVQAIPVAPAVSTPAPAAADSAAPASQPAEALPTVTPDSAPPATQPTDLQ